MKIERLRKIVIIALSVLAVLVVGVAIYYGLTSSELNSEKKQAEKISNDLVQNWYNYETQTSASYQQSIKPYLTTNFYNATAQANTSRPQDFVDELPLTSKILHTATTTIDNSSATIVVNIGSQEKGGSNYETTVTIALVRISDNWYVSNLEEQ